MTHRSEAYLAFIRSEPCMGICGESEHLRNGPNFTGIEAAHCRILGGGGVGLKPSDFYAIPLCNRCHGMQHQKGERTFWDFLRVDPADICTMLMAKYAALIGRGKDVLKHMENFCAEL